MSLKIGITGGIGSGKSFVCSIFEKLGAPVYKADDAAKRLMNDDAALRQQITALLGEEAYKDGQLNRSFVAEKVFGNNVLLESLNALVHPAVASDFEAWLKANEDAPYIVKEAAILIETGQHKLLDHTVLVTAPEALRIARVMKRDATSKQQVEARMAQQLSEEEKRKHATSELVNDEQSLLLPQVIALHQYLLQQCGKVS